MKIILRFISGYVIGDLIVTLILLGSDKQWISHFGGAMFVLSLWAPIGMVYGLLIPILFKWARVADLFGIMEICGVCVGSFPLYCGFWPTYWMRSDLALAITLIQWLSICTVLAVGVAIKKMREFLKREKR
jgi:hypothetical protein